MQKRKKGFCVKNSVLEGGRHPPRYPAPILLPLPKHQTPTSHFLFLLASCSLRLSLCESPHTPPSLCKCIEGKTPPSPSKSRLVMAQAPSLQLQLSPPNHLSSLTASGVKPISTCLHHPSLQPTCFVPADRYCHCYFLASILFLFNPLICFSPTLLISQSAHFSSPQQ